MATLAIGMTGRRTMRVLTDVSAERYCTVVSEMEVPSIEAFTELSRKASKIPSSRTQ